jgi:hypothetical protein
MDQRRRSSAFGDAVHRRRGELVRTDRLKQIGSQAVGISPDRHLECSAQQTIAAELGKQFCKCTRPRPMKGRHVVGETEVGKAGRRHGHHGDFRVSRSLSN